MDSHDEADLLAHLEAGRQVTRIRIVDTEDGKRLVGDKWTPDGWQRVTGPTDDPDEVLGKIGDVHGDS